MAILKFINDPADFTTLNAPVSTNSNFFDVTRIDNGYLLDSDSAHNLAAEWPEAAGNEVWMHFIGGWDGRWNDTVLRIEDAASNEVIIVFTSGGRTFVRLLGDTNSELDFVTPINALLVWDIHFVKNGTTDITATVYINGTFQGTLTRPNTSNKGTPTSLTSNPTNVINSNNWYFGECVIADEDTRGWRLYQLKPTAFGVNQEWDGDASSVVDGSLLTGISTDVANERASFGVSRIENIADSALIDRIAIQTYGQRGASGLTAFNHYFRYESGTIEDDTDNALGLTADMYIDEYSLNPDTGTAWAVADMQGLQIGVRART